MTDYLDCHLLTYPLPLPPLGWWRHLWAAPYFLSFSLWNLSLIAILRLTFKRSNFGPKLYYMIQNRKMTQGIVFGRFVGSRAVTGVRWLSVLWETDNCWICWERAIRMHQIPNWEVEDVLKEKEGLTNVSCSVQFTWARSRQCIDKIWMLMFFHWEYQRLTQLTSRYGSIKIRWTSKVHYHISCSLVSLSLKNSLSLAYLMLHPSYYSCVSLNRCWNNPAGNSQ